MWRSKSSNTDPEVAGWYADPEGSDELVFFDGSTWTDSKMKRLDRSLSRTTQAPTPSPPSPPKSATPASQPPAFQSQPRSRSQSQPPPPSFPRALSQHSEPDDRSFVARFADNYAAGAKALVRPKGRLALNAWGVFHLTNLAILIGLAFGAPTSVTKYVPWLTLVFLGVLLITSIPRLHDGGHSGKQLLWLPALALPIIGWIQGIDLARKLFSTGLGYGNKWGPPPR